jgi:hypothetical protein
MQDPVTYPGRNSEELLTGAWGSELSKVMGQPWHSVYNYNHTIKHTGVQQ